MRRNTYDMMTFCLCVDLSCIYCLLLHIDRLHDIFNLAYLFLTLITYQNQLIILTLFLSFLNTLAMLILVLKKCELGQANIFPYICCKNFQIHLQVIMCNFERTNHDNHEDFLFKIFPYFLACL